jgi:hypothetical protein
MPVKGKHFPLLARTAIKRALDGYLPVVVKSEATVSPFTRRVSVPELPTYGHRE